MYHDLAATVYHEPEWLPYNRLMHSLSFVTHTQLNPLVVSSKLRVGDAVADAVAELEKQLLLERANNQKMMLQMLEMQNDVNRSSAKIVELKQESAGLRSQLVARDRMHADDARMRLQLGKRLQQLVFDNAALRRTCDDLERQAAR